jgi:hypothetical protein
MEVAREAHRGRRSTAGWLGGGGNTVFPATVAALAVHNGRCRVLRHNTDERKVWRGFNSDREARRVELTMRVVGGAFFGSSDVGKWLRSAATRKWR